MDFFFIFFFVLGWIGALFLAFFIGANDVSVAMAATYGCKALSLPKIVIVASVFELIGAVFLGGFVSKTVSSGLVDLSSQVNGTAAALDSVSVLSALPDAASSSSSVISSVILPLHSKIWKDDFLNSLLESAAATTSSSQEYTEFVQLYMLSMVCVLFGSGIFLAIATCLSLPVSTTHSVVGSVIGNGLLIAGFGAIKWSALGMIVASWVLSPAIGAAVAFAAWLLLKMLVVNVKRPRVHMLTAAPFLIAGTSGILLLFIIDKGISTFLKGFGVRIPWYVSVSLSVVLALVVGIASALLFVPFASRKIQRLMENHTPDLPSAQEEIDGEDILVKKDVMQEGVPSDTTASIPGTDSERELDTFGSKSVDSMESHFSLVDDVIEKIQEPARLKTITEKTVFNALVIVTSCAIATAHGSNDNSNCSGPFAAITYMFMERKMITESSTTAWWCNVVTAIGLVVGLTIFGYPVMRTMGEKIVKLTPSRAFVSQLGTALITLTFSVLGFPMSTTHVSVGAIYGIGFVDIATKDASWKDLKLSLVMKIVVCCVFTIPLAALFSGILLLVMRLICGL